jgi:hypothetical protein
MMLFLSSMEKATQHLDLLRETGTSSLKLAIAATARFAGIAAAQAQDPRLSAADKTSRHSVAIPNKQPSAGAHRRGES